MVVRALVGPRPVLSASRRTTAREIAAFSAPPSGRSLGELGWAAMLRSFSSSTEVGLAPGPETMNVTPRGGSQLAGTGSDEQDAVSQSVKRRAKRVRLFRVPGTATAMRGS